MSKSAFLGVVGVVALVAVGGCALDLEEPEVESTAAPLRYKLPDYVNARTALTLTLATPLSLGPYCPTGGEPYALSNQVCQDPILYNCTAYYCNDASGTPYLASMPPGRSNPECRQADMQTEACSSNPSIPERYIPSREDLVERAPRFFPKEYLKVPLQRR